MNITDDLFLSVSNIVNIRITPSNLRAKMDQISGIGGITNAVKTSIIIELLLAFSELEKKLDEQNVK